MFAVQVNEILRLWEGNHARKFLKVRKEDKKYKHGQMYNLVLQPNPKNTRPANEIRFLPNLMITHVISQSPR